MVPVCSVKRTGPIAVTGCGTEVAAAFGCEVLVICKTTDHLGCSTDWVCMYCPIVDIFPSKWHHQPAFLLGAIPLATII